MSKILRFTWKIAPLLNNMFLFFHLFHSHLFLFCFLFKIESLHIWKMAIFISKAIWKSGLTQGTFHTKQWMLDKLLVTHQFANKFDRKCNCFWECISNSFGLLFLLIRSVCSTFFCCLWLVHYSFLHIYRTWVDSEHSYFIHIDHWGHGHLSVFHSPCPPKEKSMNICALQAT